MGSLRGTLADRGPRGDVLVEVGGVGYRLTVTASTARGLGAVGGPAHLLVHHLIREDSQALYGFGTRTERDCFEALLGAHGVGPALALAILSVHGPVELLRVLAEEDLDALCLVPGVGRKTAQRLLVELKARLDVESLAGPVATNGAGGPATNGAALDTAPRTVVRQALVELGYSSEEARLALDGMDEDRDEAALLRGALQRLAR
ncbi:MAG: Holliday junction branch migration protein RuvA [Acidimicrobiia bacterium]|nr:Holliday junction branch migration protein RuvA [Acidimicrobiia bacterium]